MATKHSISHLTVRPIITCAYFFINGLFPGLGSRSRLCLSLISRYRPSNRYWR